MHAGRGTFGRRSRRSTAGSTDAARRSRRLPSTTSSRKPPSVGRRASSAAMPTGSTSGSPSTSNVSMRSREIDGLRDRTFAYPWVSFERIEDEYAKPRNLDRVQTTEDVFLGKQFTALVGYSPRGDGFLVGSTSWRDGWRFRKRRRLVVRPASVRLLELTHRARRKRGLQCLGPLPPSAYTAPGAAPGRPSDRHRPTRSRPADTRRGRHRSTRLSEPVPSGQSPIPPNRRGALLHGLVPGAGVTRGRGRVRRRREGVGLFCARGKPLALPG